MENLIVAGTFSHGIDGKQPSNFRYVTAWRTAKYIVITGSVEEWEQPVEQVEVRLADTITSGRYDLRSSQVQLFDIRTGVVNTRYSTKSLTLNLTVDHATKSIEGTYTAEADEIYPGGSGVGVKLEGRIDVKYMMTLQYRR
ncbi:hypothetical protein [Pseudomonas tolaasii]|uniref:hypothetical protein n=1 Tax=Pseudomonas tolaasii TaxID=29442 RepID=UPI00036A0B5E|nr:hypothetical protein [Pseudomonas tolaasii]